MRTRAFALGLLVGLLAAWFLLEPRATPVAAAGPAQYRVVYSIFNTVERDLNAQAADGWELVAVTPEPDESHVLLTLKKNK